MRRPAFRFLTSAAVGGLTLVAAACSSDSATPTSTALPTPTTAAITRKDDGILMIGVLTPQDSANADIGQAIRSAVGVAVEKINAAGGYNGQAVQLMRADEDVAGIGADPAIATLLADGVDAIVGPASSTNALSGLGEIVDAGVVSCSPTASTSLLDDFPDRSLFFRTIPSDSLQAIAIAEQVDQTGASQATIAYIDDAYGQTFADSVESAMRLKGIETAATVPFSTDNASIKAAADEVAQTAVHVVVVIGDAISGPVMLGAVDAAAPVTKPTFVINDAMRRPSASGTPFAGSLAERITGVSPVAYTADEAFLAEIGGSSDNPSPYAANAYDCVNLIALAAMASHTTEPSAIASEIGAVSASGSPCMNFVDCRVDMDAGSNINYDGPSGSVTIGSKGDLSEAVFEVFGFDESGRDFKKATVQVSS